MDNFLAVAAERLQVAQVAQVVAVMVRLTQWALTAVVVEVLAQAVAVEVEMPLVLQLLALEAVVE